MNAKELLNDLKGNVIFLKNSFLEGKFSDYWLLDFVSAKVETLGKLLMASDSAINSEAISRWAFSYAIFKLDSFKNYRQYTLKFDKPNTEILKYLSEGNVSDSQRILLDPNWKSNFSLYKLLRCNFQHKSAPAPYGKSIIGFDSNSRPNIDKAGNLIFGSIDFTEAFINGIGEIINTKDPKVMAFIQKDDYLKVTM